MKSELFSFVSPEKLFLKKSYFLSRSHMSAIRHHTVQEGFGLANVQVIPVNENLIYVPTIVYFIFLIMLLSCDIYIYLFIFMIFSPRTLGVSEKQLNTITSMWRGNEEFFVLIKDKCIDEHI